MFDVFNLIIDISNSNLLYLISNTWYLYIDLLMLQIRFNKFELWYQIVCLFRYISNSIDSISNWIRAVKIPTFDIINAILYISKWLLIPASPE